MTRKLSGLLGAAILFLSASGLRCEIKVEEQEVGPTGPTVKYAVSPHALHIASATLQGSRQVMVIDGVAGPKFDELVWVRGTRHEPYSLFHHRIQVDDEMKRDESPIVFSDDGSRHAYVARQGTEFVLMVDGKELTRGPYLSNAIEDLAFTPGGKHVHFVETLGKVGNNQKFLVVDDRKESLAAPATEISWSPDGEHHAYIIEGGDNSHLVVDGKRDPPELSFPQYECRRDGPPIFTGDSAHLITIRHRRQPGTARILDTFGPPTIFFDRQLKMEMPRALSYGKLQPAEVEELSASPTATDFLTVFHMPNNPYRIYFNTQRLEPEVFRVNHIGWSPDGKHYAVSCETEHQSVFMFIDGKPEPEYKSLNTRNGLAFDFAPFTADSSKCVYIAGADVGGVYKNFVVVNDEESDGYLRVDNLKFSKQGAHIAFIADTDDEQKMLVVDGKALEPRKNVQDFAFTNDGGHYSFLSSSSNSGNALFIDGIEQPNPFGGDFVHYSSSSREEFRQSLISPDGQHSVYSANIGTVQYTGKPRKGICLDGKIMAGDNEYSEFTPFFTPDNKHLVWIDWGGKFTAMGGGSQYDFSDVPGFSVYVDGKAAGHYDCPTVHLAGSSTSTARFFRDHKNAAELNTDGSLTMYGQVGNVIKKLHIIPPADSDLTSFASAADASKEAAERKAQDQPTPSNW